MTGFVYIIRCGDFAKIGYSTNPKRRLGELSSLLPFPLTLVATFPATPYDEKRLHWFLALEHERGEWFRWCKEIENIVAHGVPRSDDEPTAAGQIKLARQQLRESQARFAKRFGVNQATIHRWETKGIPDSGPARAAIELLWPEIEREARTR